MIRIGFRPKPKRGRTGFALMSSNNSRAVLFESSTVDLPRRSCRLSYAASQMRRRLENLRLGSRKSSRDPLTSAIALTIRHRTRTSRSIVQSVSRCAQTSCERKFQNDRKWLVLPLKYHKDISLGVCKVRLERFQEMSCSHPGAGTRSRPLFSGAQSGCEKPSAKHLWFNQPHGLRSGSTIGQYDGNARRPGPLSDAWAAIARRGPER